MRKTIKRVFLTLCILFILLNILIARHCYKLTHVVDSVDGKELHKEITFANGLRFALLGIDIPCSRNTQKPSRPYQELRISVSEEKSLHSWFIPTHLEAKGTVLIFHGYGDNKGSMVGIADEFANMGYNSLLVDFMGTGESMVIRLRWDIVRQKMYMLHIDI